MATPEEIAALQAQIVEAKAALHQIMCGDKVVQTGFGTNRLTQWGAADSLRLTAYISGLEDQLYRLLGQRRRGPIYPMGFPR